MPLRSAPIRVARRPRTVRFENFVGLRLDDAHTGWDPRYFGNLVNMNVRPDGSVYRRWGCPAISGTISSPQAGYWSQALGLGFVQIGTQIYKTTDFVTFNLIATMSTSATGFFTDYLGKLVYVHPVDGVFTYDGTTWALSTAAVKGTMAAVWQNKLWVSGDPGAATTVKWTDAGAMTFGASNFVLFRDVDDTPITAIGAGQRFDFTSKPTLLVYKRRSWYRINDSSTGAYTTLSVEAGCAGPRAVASASSRICAFTDNGIWMTDGIAVPVRVSDAVKPLFRDTELDLANFSKAAAGSKDGRLYFAFPRVGASGANRSVLEFDPLRGGFALHAVIGGTASVYLGDYGIADFINLRTSTVDKLYLVPGGGPATQKILAAFSVGVTADDISTAINSTVRTAIVGIKGERARIARMIFRGTCRSSNQTVAPFSMTNFTEYEARALPGGGAGAYDDQFTMFDFGSDIVCLDFAASSSVAQIGSIDPLASTVRPNFGIRWLEFELVPISRF